MNTLFAERFKSARIMKGLSLQDISDKLNNQISRQAIHKYEKGEATPDSEMLGLLCDILGVRPDFFTRKPHVTFGEINFRKINDLPQKDQNRIVEKTKDELERYLELEEIIGISESFEKPATAFVVNNEAIEDFAQNLRKQWGLDNNPIVNVIDTLETNNIKVIDLHESDEFDGLQTWNGNQPIIVINSQKLKSEDRKRFTALHELGHLLLPLSDVADNMAEKYCHTFAGAMLLPKNVILKEIGDKREKISIQELGMIKQKYGISIQAIVYRLSVLGVISESYKKYYFEYIKQMNWREVEPYSYENKEQSLRFNRLLYRALSEDKISMSKAAALKNMKLADFRKELMMVI